MGIEATEIGVRPQYDSEFKETGTYFIYETKSTETLVATVQGDAALEEALKKYKS